MFDLCSCTEYWVVCRASNSVSIHHIFSYAYDRSHTPITEAKTVSHRKDHKWRRRPQCLRICPLARHNCKGNGTYLCSQHASLIGLRMIHSVDILVNGPINPAISGGLGKALLVIASMTNVISFLLTTQYWPHDCFHFSKSANAWPKMLKEYAIPVGSSFIHSF